MKDPVPRHHVTQKDVANALGISHTTVSLALQGNPKITGATRQRVITKAEEMGYQPNAMASGLAQFRRNSKSVPVRAAVAWINAWPQPDNLRRFREFEMYWRGAEATALQSGYHLDEFKVSGGVSLPRLEKIITARGIRGILLPPHPFRMDWAVFNWGRFSVVRFGRSIESLPFHLVTADHVANTILAFNAIRARGCQRIGMALQQNRRHLLLDAGFLKAQLDVPEKQRLPMCLLDESADMQPQFERWLKKHRPDAVFTEMPQIRDMLGRAGLRVPEDIGMAANSVLDGHADAGIDQNPEEIGRVAMLLLISLMHDNDRGIPPIPHELLVKGKWVDGSTLPPRL